MQKGINVLNNIIFEVMPNCFVKSWGIVSITMLNNTEIKIKFNIVKVRKKTETLKNDKFRYIKRNAQL